MCFAAQSNNAGFESRAARFFMAHDAKTGKNVSKELKMYQKVIKYDKCP
jgi:hypothetical protein